MKNIIIHEKSIVETKRIGAGSRIWAYTHILPGAIIGENCNVCDFVFIENDVVIGNNVTIKSGVQLWDGIIIEDNVFIGPNVTLTNDPFPRSKQYPETFLKTIIRKNSSIGANATLLPGITIGKFAMVGAGSVVTKDVPPFAIVVGNPARISGYAKSKKELINQDKNKSHDGIHDLSVQCAKLVEHPIIEDLRGRITFSEINEQLPFIPKRFFLIYDVPSSEIRGEHAHKTCHQFLISVNGCCTVMLDDGKYKSEVKLDNPNLGLYIPPLIWASQFKYTSDAKLLVLASDIYNPEDYIRDYDQFLSVVENL